jgi:hypothetical protein
MQWRKRHCQTDENPNMQNRIPISGLDIFVIVNILLNWMLKNFLFNWINIYSFFLHILRNKFPKFIHIKELKKDKRNEVEKHV